MKRQDEKIICPKCKTVQLLDIYDLTDPEDTHGSFPTICYACKEKFRVSYSFRPFVEEQEMKE